jgi:DNA (cytosine-5)-methyltransferase 1
MNSTAPALALQYLQEAARYYTHTEIAQRLGVSPSTVSRWLTKEAGLKPYLVETLQQMLHPFGSSRPQADFTFIDLFAGIGGIRKAFELHGGQCVFTSEWDAYAQKTYHANFADDAPINGDITDVDERLVPNHDVLLAGFPCQPFSIAGVSKKNALGRAHGFADETQGTLFFDVARIIQEKAPKAFVLENVKNLKSHDRGRTFDVIIRTLRDELGYHVHYRIIDGQHWTPQHRERIVIVGFREPTPFSWDSLQLPEKGEIKMSAILHKQDGSEPRIEHDGDKYFNHETGTVNSKYTLTPKLWEYLQNYALKHKAKGNGFGYGLVGPNDIARTLSARYYKDGSEILVSQGKGRNPRRLTPRECARLMGYPDDFKIPVSDTRAYKQFGNSVVMPVFKEVARIIRPWLVQDTFTPVVADLFTDSDVGVRVKRRAA